MNQFLELWTDYTFQTVALGCGILGIVSGIIGSFAVLRRQSLLGDGVSHAALPGVVLAFLVTGSKNTEILLSGALISALLAAGAITAIVRRSRVKFDSALALVMSVFFGFGMVCLTYAQKIPDATQAGLKRFLFGQASTLVERDVLLMMICGAVLLFAVLVLWKELQLFSFDMEFGQSVGFSSGLLNGILIFLIVTDIMIGLQTVGVILMSALLIAPGAAARQWTNHLSGMVFLAAVFGAAGGIFGTVLSSLLPQMPTGPAIVLFVSAIVAISMLFAPHRGIIGKLFVRHKAKKAWKTKGGEKYAAAN